MNLKQQLHRAVKQADAGDWNAAHEIVQDLEHPLAAWIHANLHREEGDEGNARYWYERAGRDFSRLALTEERVALSEAIEQEL